MRSQLFSLVAPRRALAWGPEGHREVGLLADKLLKGHANAKAQVREILGSVTLGDAGSWADCIRSVSGPAGGFKYTHSDLYGGPCVVFETPERTGYMEDYVRRNWSNCSYTGSEGCHTQYHFVDLGLARSEYRLGLVRPMIMTWSTGSMPRSRCSATSPRPHRSSSPNATR